MMINDETPNYSKIFEQLHHVPFWNWHIPCQPHRWCSFSKGGVLYVGFLEGMNIVKYDFWNWRAFHEILEKQEMGREVGVLPLVVILDGSGSSGNLHAQTTINK